MPEPNATEETAAELNDLAVKRQAEGNYAEADHLYKKSAAIWEATRGSEDPLVAQSLSNRASLYRRMGAYDEAERLFQVALRIWSRRGFPTQHGSPLWADTLENDFTLKHFGADVRHLRDRVLKGNAEARTELTDIIRRLGPWYHNVEFAPGIMTNPSNRDYPASRWRILEKWIPKTLEGKSVLDIGVNSGYLSLETKKRGADRVVGVDIMLYLLAQARFLSHWFERPLELYECGAYDVESLGSKFDIVLFVGVLYHLKHPLYALEKVSAVCKDTMYIQTTVRGPGGDMEPADDYPGTEVAVFHKPEWPKMYFIEKKFNGDESNWWFVSRSALKAMLRTVGFRSIEDTESSEIFVCRK